jgi:hypothetical protein
MKSGLITGIGFFGCEEITNDLKTYLGGNELFCCPKQ